MIEKQKADDLATEVITDFLQRSDCQNIKEIEDGLALLLSRISFLLLKTRGKATVAAMLIALGKRYEELPEEASNSDTPPSPKS